MHLIKEYFHQNKKKNYMNKENEFLVKRYIFSYLILKIKIFTGIYFNYF
jgi:hypothetical protein